MEMIGCECDGFPAHDHWMGVREINGVWQNVWDNDDIGRVWVDWKAVAKTLLLDTERDNPTFNPGSGVENLRANVEQNV